MAFTTHFEKIILNAPKKQYFLGPCCIIATFFLVLAKYKGILNKIMNGDPKLL